MYSNTFNNFSYDDVTATKVTSGSDTYCHFEVSGKKCEELSFSMYNKDISNPWNDAISFLDKDNKLIFPGINATTIEPINKEVSCEFDAYGPNFQSKGSYLPAFPSNLNVSSPITNQSKCVDNSDLASHQITSATVRNILGLAYKAAFGKSLDYSKITGNFEGGDHCKMIVEGKRCEDLIFNNSGIFNLHFCSADDYCFGVDILDKNKQGIIPNVTSKTVTTQSKITKIEFECGSGNWIEYKYSPASLVNSLSLASNSESNTNNSFIGCDSNSILLNSTSCEDVTIGYGKSGVNSLPYSAFGVNNGLTTIAVSCNATNDALISTVVNVAV